MKAWRTRVLIGVGSVVLLVLATVVSLMLIAHARGARALEPAASGLIAQHLAQADYVDAYRIPLDTNDLVTMADVIAAAFQKGREVARSDREVVYRGGAPGLEFHVSYLLRGEQDATELVMTTAVHYTSGRGRLYFAMVRHVHRMLMPFMVSRMRRQIEGRRS